MIKGSINRMVRNQLNSYKNLSSDINSEDLLTLKFKVEIPKALDTNNHHSLESTKEYIKSLPAHKYRKLLLQYGILSLDNTAIITELKEIRKHNETKSFPLGKLQSQELKKSYITLKRSKSKSDIISELAEQMMLSNNRTTNLDPWFDNYKTVRRYLLSEIHKIWKQKTITEIENVINNQLKSENSTELINLLKKIISKKINDFNQGKKYKDGLKKEFNLKNQQGYSLLHQYSKSILKQSLGINLEDSKINNSQLVTLIKEKVLKNDTEFSNQFLSNIYDDVANGLYQYIIKLIFAEEKLLKLKEINSKEYFKLTGLFFYLNKIKDIKYLESRIIGIIRNKVEKKQLSHEKEVRLKAQLNLKLKKFFNEYINNYDDFVNQTTVFNYNSRLSNFISIYSELKKYFITHSNHSKPNEFEPINDFNKNLNDGQKKKLQTFTNKDNFRDIIPDLQHLKFDPNTSFPNYKDRISLTELIADLKKDYDQYSQKINNAYNKTKLDKLKFSQLHIIINQNKIFKQIQLFKKTDEIDDIVSKAREHFNKGKKAKIPDKYWLDYVNQFEKNNQECNDNIFDTYTKIANNTKPIKDYSKSLYRLSKILYVKFVLVMLPGLKLDNPPFDYFQELININKKLTLIQSYWRDLEVPRTRDTIYLSDFYSRPENANSLLLFNTNKSGFGSMELFLNFGKNCNQFEENKNSNKVALNYTYPKDDLVEITNNKIEELTNQSDNLDQFLIDQAKVDAKDGIFNYHLWNLTTEPTKYKEFTKPNLTHIDNLKVDFKNNFLFNIHIGNNQKIKYLNNFNITKQIINPETHLKLSSIKLIKEKSTINNITRIDYYAVLSIYQLTDLSCEKTATIQSQPRIIGVDLGTYQAVSYGIIDNEGYILDKDYNRTTFKQLYNNYVENPNSVDYLFPFAQLSSKFFELTKKRQKLTTNNNSTYIDLELRKKFSHLSASSQKQIIAQLIKEVIKGNQVIFEENANDTSKRTKKIGHVYEQTLMNGPKIYNRLIDKLNLILTTNDRELLKTVNESDTSNICCNCGKKFKKFETETEEFTKIWEILEENYNSNINLFEIINQIRSLDYSKLINPQESEIFEKVNLNSIYYLSPRDLKGKIKFLGKDYSKEARERKQGGQLTDFDNEIIFKGLSYSKAIEAIINSSPSNDWDIKEAKEDVIKTLFSKSPLWLDNDFSENVIKVKYDSDCDFNHYVPRIHKSSICYNCTFITYNPKNRLNSKGKQIENNYNFSEISDALNVARKYILCKNNKEFENEYGNNIDKWNEIN
jgi:hypothetical protein